MEPFKKILAPVDLSDISLPVLKMSKVVAEGLGAHLNVVNIVEEQILSAFIGLGKEKADYIDKSKKMLDGMVIESDVVNTKHSSEVIIGIPFMEIISRSADLGSELIVLGGTPANELNNLGKNAFKIVRMAPFHTLAVKPKSNNFKTDSVPVKNIMVALDFSEHSLMALDYTLLLKPIFGAKVQLLHIVSEKDLTTVEDVKSKLRNHISDEKFNAIDCIKVFNSDNVSRGILRQVISENTDLLVVGSHSRRRFLRNLFLGKVAYDVVRKADCSVLVLKQPLDDKW